MDPSFCQRGCGFFGSPQQYNLCSKCYRDYLKEKIAASSSTAPPSSDPSPADTSVIVNESINQIAKLSLSSTAAENVCEPAKPIRNRCKTCKKKVGLLGFQCRCGGLFCGTHRYPEEHACTVDLRTTGREALRKQNPECVADRLKYRI